MQKYLKSLLVAAACTAISFSTAYGSVTITAKVDNQVAAFVENTLSVDVGQEVELTATWSTAKDVTRYEWIVDGATVEGGEITDAGEKLNGTRSRVILEEASEGTYEIRFRVWHHSQSDREEFEDVTVDVTMPDEAVEYGINGLLSPWAAGKAFKVGSVIPLKWQYTLLNTETCLDEIVESGDFEISVFADLHSTLNDPTVDAEGVYAAGNSGYQYDALTGTHQMNWQTKGWSSGTYTLYIVCESDLGTQINTFSIQLRK
jgi:plastocyanin